MIGSGNLFSGIDACAKDEVLHLLASSPGVKIERIVSTGQCSPPGFWYEQASTEWVFLVSGAAGLLIEGEAEARVLKPGDYLELPAHLRHRVEWTDATQPTVWLAVHLEAHAR